MPRRGDRPAALLVALIAGMMQRPPSTADPAHPDGAIAAVEGHGLMFVRVDGR